MIAQQDFGYDFYEKFVPVSVKQGTHVRNVRENVEFINT